MWGVEDEVKKNTNKRWDAKNVNVGMNGFVKSSTKLSNHAWFYDNIILKFMFFFAVATTSVVLNIYI